MTALPSGTLTFLFTDIVGSTTRWEHQPTAMQQALVRHDALIRVAIADHGGHVFKTVGDAFCTVFTRAPDALAGALAAQRALRDEPWPPDCALEVRMALHTGTADERDGDYFGATINRVARLLAVGHGGQMLLTAATQELVRDQPPPGAALHDLGMHRLKDLIRPEQIFQLSAPDLPSNFPALRTLDAHPNNLPVLRAPLLGREREIRELMALLLRDHVGLVTLTGPGGTGKTRLALQIAAELLDTFPDGAWFVDLSAVTDPAQVPATIAQTLGLRENEGQALAESVRRFLREKRLLLVLDNFEQIAPAAPFVGDMLSTAEHMTVLVTSRVPLHLKAEHEYPVLPLAVPDPRQLPPLSALNQYAAVALFVERAQAVKPDFAVTNQTAPAVAEICVRLDGLPLAIELAAARSKLFTPPALLKRLDQRLVVLTGGAHDLPGRHQTLRAMIDWSYQLLDPAEQQLFARLAIFAGGWTIEAAEAICGDDGATDMLGGLESLLDKSLVRQQPDTDDEPRFTMLETLREFAGERLAGNGELERLRERHAAHYLALAEAAAPHIRSHDQLFWLPRLVQEHDNFRAALSWSTAQPQVQTASRIVLALALFWILLGQFGEAELWLRELLKREALLQAEQLPRLLYFAAHCVGTTETSRQNRRRCIEEATKQGDRQTLALALLLEASDDLGSKPDKALVRKQWDQCIELLEEVGPPWALAAAINDLGTVAHLEGRHEDERTLYERGLQFARNSGDRSLIAYALQCLGGTAFEQRNLPQAHSFLAEALDLSQQLGDKLRMIQIYWLLGDIARSAQSYTTAAAHYAAEWQLARAIGVPSGEIEGLCHLASILVVQGELSAAEAQLRTALELLQQDPWTLGYAWLFEGLAELALARHRPERSARLWGTAVALRDSVGFPPEMGDVDRLETLVSHMKSGLGADIFERLRAEGQGMELDQALAYALQRPEP